MDWIEKENHYIAYTFDRYWYKISKEDWSIQTEEYTITAESLHDAQGVTSTLEKLRVRKMVDELKTQVSEDVEWLSRAKADRPRHGFKPEGLGCLLIWIPIDREPLDAGDILEVGYRISEDGNNADVADSLGFGKISMDYDKTLGYFRHSDRIADMILFPSRDSAEEFIYIENARNALLEAFSVENIKKAETPWKMELILDILGSEVRTYDVLRKWNLRS